MPTEVRRIAGWNVNGLRARFDRLDSWLIERAPDIVALQELRCPPTTTSVLANRLGHDAAIGEHAAILVPSGSESLTNSADLLGDGRAMAATVGCHRIVSVYAPNGSKARTAAHRAKLAWFESFAHALDAEMTAAANNDLDLIVVGDLNIARAEVDIWRPERYRTRNLFTPEERAAMHALLDLGLDDVFRSIHKGAGLYTWWNHAHDSFERNRGWRLDYVLTTPDVTARVEHAVVDVEERARPRTSDHAPLWIDLDRDPEP